MKKAAHKPESLARPAQKNRPEERATPAGQLPRLQFCFFLSGAAGLIYQVVWTKQLGQLFGYSAYAVATVLAAFMGGMALGSALFARWRPAHQSGVAAYAWLEFGIALGALLSLPGIPLVRWIYFSSYPHASGWTGFLVVLRFAGSALILALPTILMGATLPVLLGGTSREAGEMGVRASRFYAINTAGGALGTLAAGFWLIPWMGLRFTLITAVLLNLLAGTIAAQISRLAARKLEEATSAGRADGPRPMSWAYLVCFAAVGATAITYELGWTRLLATPLGSSTYAFSLMLATFLLGICIGSALFEKWYLQSRTATSSLFATTQLVIAAFALISLWVFHEIPELLLAMLRSFGEGFPGLLLAQAGACAVALLPMTIVFGFNFPAVLALITGGGRDDEITVSANVGRAAAANTLGAILAAILCGFFVLPRTGSFRLIAAAACLNIVISVVLFSVSKRRDWKPWVAAALLLIATIWTAASPAFFSQTSAAFGVVLYRGVHSPGLAAREMADTEDVLFFRDGINATIAVTRSEDYVALKTNGKVDASNLDTGTQLLLADLGAVFHPNPRRVLVIGFGGGMTVSAVSRFPEVQRIDCVEIEPAVLEAASHLERLHRGVLGDERLYLHFDDARNFLQTSREQYDLIISEPSNPWISGIASLYTREFFQIVRQHLAPGGSFVQWIQAYGLNPRNFSMILASLGPEFQDLTLWHSSGRDFLVLARSSRVPLDFQRSRALWNRRLLQQDFKALHLERPEGWPAYLRADDAGVRRIATGAPINTDDLTKLEYAAPQQLLNAELTGELEKYVQAFAPELQHQFPSEDLEKVALASAETALEVNPLSASRFLELLQHDTESPEAVVLRARADLAAGQNREAEKDLSEARAISAAEGTANRFAQLYWLTMALRDQGRLADATAALEQALALQPEDTQALGAASDLARRRQDWTSAISAQTKLVNLRPDSSADHCQLGDLFLRARELKAAEPPLLKGLELEPYAFLCHRDLGELYRATGRTPEAAQELEWVVRYFPEGDAKTYVSLALAYQRLGRHPQADQALQKGRRLFPRDPILGRFALK